MTDTTPAGGDSSGAEMADFRTTSSSEVPPSPAGPLDESAPGTPPNVTTPVKLVVPDRRGAPPAVMTMFVILLAAGGALEGYAVALAASGDQATRWFSLIWALLGAALVVTAWALRGRRWWGTAAAIGVAIVGLFAGMYGVSALLVVANSPSGSAGDASGQWLTAVGLIAVGAASIAILGLLSTAWSWLTAPNLGRRSTDRPSPTPTGA